MPRILVTSGTLAPEAMALLREAGAAVAMMPGPVTGETVVAALREAPTAAVILRNNPAIGRAALEAAPGLRVIARHGVGINSLDLAALTEAGVPVTLALGANTEAVAEHTIALILALGRDLPRLDAGMKAGRWEQPGYLGREVAGRVLGLVGFGAIARRVAVTARALGLDVLALPRRPGSVDPALAREAASLAALAAEADIVSLHLPLTEATRGLFGRDLLRALRPGALLINTARGGIVDEAALAECLRDGRIAGAALDTLEEEPPPAGHPLRSAPNVILTPHVAAFTEGAMRRMGIMAARHALAVLRGERLDPAVVANPSVLASAGG